MPSVPTNRLKDDRYYTPTGAVRQLFDIAPWEAHGFKPKRILDCAAGPGVFPMCAREKYPEATIIGIEKNRKDERSLQRHCDRVYIGNFLQWRTKAPYDLIVTNPPFSLLSEYLDHATKMLTFPSGTICFLGRTEFGQAENTIDLLTKHKPYELIRIGGRLSFRRDGKTDSNEYSWWMWRPTVRWEGIPRWMTRQLPYLPKEARRWTTIPGTEQRRRIQYAKH